MKKITLLIALLMMLATLSACGPSADDIVEEEVAALPTTSGTEIDVQLGTTESATSSESQATESEVADTSDAAAQADSVVAEPVVVPELINEIEPPTDTLLAQIPEYDPADVQETASGLQYVIYEEGSGDTPLAGDTVVAHYTGYLANGTKFDSSVDRGQTFEFPLGQQRVIAGWDEGFGLMNPGTKALLIIPPGLGYGVAGAGADIPPNATLYFDVELVDIRGARRITPVAEEDYTVTDAGLKLYDITVGDGDEVTDGRVAVLDFALWDLATGQMMGASDEVGQPLSFKVGGEQMFAALQDGIEGMQVGGSRQIYMPATAIEGQGFPPGSDIVFEVDLLEIRDGSPDSPTAIDDADFTTTETGVRYADIEVGSGEDLAEGGFYSMHYSAWLSDGTPFDSTLDRGQPFEFPFGGAQIPGLNEGLTDAKIGTIRQIIIPADIIGDLGLDQPYDLTFEIEILEQP